MDQLYKDVNNTTMKTNNCFLHRVKLVRLGYFRKRNAVSTHIYNQKRKNKYSLEDKHRIINQLEDQNKAWNVIETLVNDLYQIYLIPRLRDNG